MSGRRYAERTTVSVEKSRVELEQTLKRYGATAFGYAQRGDAVMVQFEIAERRIAFRLRMPDRQSRDITHTAQGARRSPRSAQEAFEQAERQRWRAINLVIKAKLESVELGIETIDEAFLANIMLPSGETVGEWIEPQIEQTYLTGQMPELMPGLGGDDPQIRALPGPRGGAA